MLLTHTLSLFLSVPQSNLPPGYINPAIPSSLLPPPPINKPVSTDGEGSDKQPPFYFTGAGPERTYANLSVIDPDAFAWPKRPAPGSAADLDVLLDHCDFSRGLVSRVAPCPSWSSHSSETHLTPLLLPSSSVIALRSSAWAAASTPAVASAEAT